MKIAIELVKTCKYGGIFLTSMAGLCISGYGLYLTWRSK